jgi:hypothetical protein
LDTRFLAFGPRMGRPANPFGGAGWELTGKPGFTLSRGKPAEPTLPQPREAGTPLYRDRRPLVSL